jgi:hypothetical protein
MSISAFSPMNAAAGNSITINGNNLSNVQEVKFGRTPAAAYAVKNRYMLLIVMAGKNTRSDPLHHNDLYVISCAEVGSTLLIFHSSNRDRFFSFRLSSCLTLIFFNGLSLHHK